MKCSQYIVDILWVWRAAIIEMSFFPFYRE
jgi:hypothetical protein